MLHCSVFSAWFSAAATDGAAVTAVAVLSNALAQYEEQSPVSAAVADKFAECHAGHLIQPPAGSVYGFAYEILQVPGDTRTGDSLVSRADDEIPRQKKNCQHMFATSHRCCFAWALIEFTTKHAG